MHEDLKLSADNICKRGRRQPDFSQPQRNFMKWNKGNEEQNHACVIMNIQYVHMIWMSQPAKLQNGNKIFENGLKAEGNEDIITDVWTDYNY